MYYGCELRVDSPTGIATGCSMFLNKTSTRRWNVEASLAQLYPQFYPYHHSLTWWIVRAFTLACVPFAVELDFLEMNCLCCENKLRFTLLRRDQYLPKSFMRTNILKISIVFLKYSRIIKQFVRVVLSNA